MEELLNELRKVDHKVYTDNYLIMGKEYVSLKIEDKSFKIISEMPPSDKYVVTFVDGGQTLIFESSFFCLGYIRTAALTYENNVRKSIDIKNFYILIKEINNKFEIKTFPKTSFENIIFNKKDLSLEKDVSCSKILPIIRRFAELEHASKFNNVLIDGTLEAKYAYELNYIKNLKTAHAISKTCSLLTNNGIGIIDVLRGIDNKSINNDAWYYYPVVLNNNKNHPAEIFFVKLNEKSDYVFRMEFKSVNNHNSETIKDKILDKNLSVQLPFQSEELLSFLKENSKDPIFLGYPYGLIDADNYARVTEQERKILQTRISIMMGKDWKNFSKVLKSMNVHEILDNIKF